MKRTVLVIDDDKMILDMIQGILEDKFEVSAVNDGQKAFRVLVGSEDAGYGWI